jgi:hypothetical protein
VRALPHIADVDARKIEVGGGGAETALWQVCDA